MKQELIKQTSRWGNGAGVLLPKEWVGQEVSITLIDRTSDIKKEVFDMLDKMLEDIIGIYLVGSYARGEQTEKSDIDIIAISNKKKKEIISGKYHISVYTLETVRKTLKGNSIMIYPRLFEAKTIINQNLLKELLLEKPKRKSFSEFIESTKRIININKTSLNLDKEYGKYASASSIYSIILRLRGMFLLKCMLKGEHYSKEAFRKWIESNVKGIDYNSFYDIYFAVKMDKKAKSKVLIADAENLLAFLKKEAKEYDK